MRFPSAAAVQRYSPIGPAPGTTFDTNMKDVVIFLGMPGGAKPTRAVTYFYGSVCRLSMLF